MISNMSELLRNSEDVAQPNRIQEIIGEKLYQVYQDEGPEFFTALANRARLMEKLKQDPRLIHTFAHYRDLVCGGSDTEIELFLTRAERRRQIIDEGHAAFRTRVQHTPFPTNEELALGTYLEFIEPQVRDAVLMLRAKGYRTISSGFGSLKHDEQAIVFQRDELQACAFSSDELNRLTEQGVECLILHEGAYDILSLVPKRPIDMVQWKTIWDRVASYLPARGEPLTTPSENFSKKVAQMREGKWTYLGAGVSYEKGQLIYEEE